MMRWHLFVFYILGHSLPNVQLNSNKHIFELWKYTPALIFLIVSCTISVFLIIWQHNFAIFNYKDSLDSILSYLLIVSEMAACITMFSQVFLYRDCLIEIFQTFRSIELFLLQKTHLKIDFRHFLKRYLKKVFLIIAVFAKMYAIKIIFQTDYSDFVMESAFFALRLFQIIAKLHMLFYVSLLKSFVKFTVNLSLFSTRIGLTVTNRGDIIETMKFYKCIHFQLFTVTTLINRAFGWSLVTQCIQSFLDSCYALYWVFIFMQKDTSAKFAIRKYEFIILFRCIY